MVHTTPEMDMDVRTAHGRARLPYLSAHARVKGGDDLTFDPDDMSLPQWYGVSRRPVNAQATAAANRSWWDRQAADYYREHGAFLGDHDLVWGPEGWTEAELGVLGEVAGTRILEIGAGSGQGARYLRDAGATVVATDLSAGMLAQGRSVDRGADVPDLPMVQCDGARLPFADAAFDIVTTAYGVFPFVADSAQVLRECARVLRSGGRVAFSATHPIRWAFPDDPGPQGLTVTSSYFDRSPYVEESESGDVYYAEHHRTLGDRVREITAAGLHLVDLVEPEWPERNQQVWGGWSPSRGRLIPGTAILVARKP